MVRDLYATDSLSDAGANALGLAQHLASIGENVTLLWVPPITVANKFDIPSRNAVIERYAQNYLVDLRMLIDVPELSPHLHCPEKASLAVYYYLKANKFDEVYSTIEGGLAYYTLMSLELGLLDPPWTFTLLVHTPTQWLQEADKTFPNDVRDLAVLHMEEYCIENSVRTVFLSEYIASWCVRAGMKPAGSQVVLPWFTPDQLLPGAHEPRIEPAQGNALEIGIWPGWEHFRGLTVLCDALDKATERGAPELTISCFGPFSRILGDHTGGMLIRRGRRWPFNIKFFPKLGERASLEYLANRGGIALIVDTYASGSRLVHACLEAAIPVIVTRTGSNSEAVAASERKFLVDATSTSLADRLVRLRCDRARALKPSHSSSERADRWERYRRQAAVRGRIAAPITRPGKEKSPRVSIIIVHHDRPEMLAESLQSVRQQDYPNIEVVLVDDGSKQEASLQFLEGLEPEFNQCGWKIIRQKNKYLGAARNRGIRASSGQFILFLDDDNALIEGAVSTFVRAMEHSKSDICTSVSKIFVGPKVPAELADGQIEYTPLGGSLDFAFLHNSYGDANAMIRRSVFDKIGYLKEDYGFVASDWEFFVRAALNGLKVRIIPEATYWYRSTAEGMFRSAHWHDTKLHIWKTFEKHKYKGLKHVYELLIMQNADASECQGLGFRLHFDPANQPYERLNAMEPESDNALMLLAEIAASEGRPDSAITLLGQFQDSGLGWRLSGALQAGRSKDALLLTSLPAPTEYRNVDMEALRHFSVASTNLAEGAPLAYTEAPDRLFIESSSGHKVVATLARAVPAGSVSVRLRACLADESGAPLQILLTVLGQNADVLLAVEAPTENNSKAILASSGWQTLKTPYLRHTIEITFREPIKSAGTLAIVIKDADGVSSPGPTMVMLEQLSYLAYQVLGKARRPRQGPPQRETRARLLADSELKSAQLATHYPGEENLLVTLDSEQGFALRPSLSGVVIAVLHWVFPAFARGVIASVEIANDNASAFEFAIALVRPSDLGKWTREGPANSVAFSGWRRVDRKFELHDITVGLSQPHRYELSICAAIRLPPGSEPEPSDAYWRKFVVRW